MLAPQWSRVRETDRGVVRHTLAGTLSEKRVAPLVRMSLRQAVTKQPELAAAALVWLRGPLGFEVKFAEATAWTGDKQGEAEFYTSVTAARENRIPSVRAERLRKLLQVGDAVTNTLNLTEQVGTVVARLVNVTGTSGAPLPPKALAQAIARERRDPEVAATYESVVLASLLLRCRDLDLEELDRYIEFSQTPAGRWYHEALATALVYGVETASVDLEGVLAANSQKNMQDEGADADRTMLQLPSGGEVRLLAVGAAGSPTAPALVLRYETSLSMQQSAAVSAQASEVWAKLRTQVEADGAKAAFLEAAGSVRGWVFPFASMRKFAWQQTKDGSWAAFSGGKPGFRSPERELLWTAPF